MYNDAKEVLRTLVFTEKTIGTDEGLYYTIRIMPYRTSEDKIEGLVITFIDITKAKQLEIRFKVKHNRYSDHLLAKYQVLLLACHPVEKSLNLTLKPKRFLNVNTLK